MEREKRLELTGANSEVAAGQVPHASLDSSDAQRDAHENQDEIMTQIHALLRLEKSGWDGTSVPANSSSYYSEIHELVNSWQTLSREIQAAILAIIRNSKS
jgi:hypothetical protein